MVTQIIQPRSIKPSVLLIGDGGVSEQVRAAMPGKALSKRGWNVLAGRFTAIAREDVKHDVAVLSRIVDQKAIRWLREAGLRIVFDIDDYFPAIPETHPGYKNMGMGNPAYIEALFKTISEADIVTTTTPELAAQLLKYNSKVHVIPNGWDQDNYLWGIKYKHPGVNIGWTGTITHREDFKVAKRPLIKLIKKYPDVHLFIGWDPEIYKMFASVSEYQKTFIPNLPFEQYPHFLSYLDIWLAPLLQNEFNRSKSDIKLMDAGASSTAYVASTTPVYERWGAGGCLVDNEDNWYEVLEWLVRNEGIRKNLAKAGSERAKQREINQLAPLWEQAIEEALR